jgi:hypothetical protein
VQGAVLDLTWVLLTNALCRMSFLRCAWDFEFFELAGNILPAALKEKT